MPRMTVTSRLKDLPVPILPTVVGAATLSNVWSPMGFTWIRHLTMWLGALVLLAYIGKIIFHFDTVKKEYMTTVPSSLMAGFSMFTMIFGSYLFPYQAVLGQSVLFFGLILHALHIILFTYIHVIKNFNKDVFVPTWFVTYAGIMVSTVVGGAMGLGNITTWVVYYGFIPVFILVPLMVYRLTTRPILDGPLFMSKAIVAAPTSLFIVSYLNIIETPDPVVVYFAYGMLALTLLFILWNLPKFFSFTFHPGFAALTFPLAIACVATNKMAAFVGEQGLPALADILTQIGGIQLYITTATVGYVVFNFFLKLRQSFKTDAA